MTDREMTTGEAEAWRKGFEEGWHGGWRASRSAMETPPETRARALPEADYARGATPVAPEPPKGASGDPGANAGHPSCLLKSYPECVTPDICRKWGLCMPTARTDEVMAAARRLDAEGA